MSKVVESYQKAKKRPLRELAEEILSALESGEVSPFRKEWDPSKSVVQLAPYNASSGRKYTGVYNATVLRRFMERAASEAKSLDTDPRYMTFNQYKKLSANAEDLKLQKESKSVGIYVPIMVTKKNADEPEVETESAPDILRLDGGKAEKTAPRKDQKILVGFRSVPVFNGAHFDGMPPFQVLPEHEERIKATVYSSLEMIMETMNMSISHGGERAFYRESDDHVQMPPLNTFSSEDCYVQVLLHEVAHSTLHPSRLDRRPKVKEIVNGLGVSDPEVVSRAIEEFVADMGSAQMCVQMNMRPLALENHEGYLESWLRPLKQHIPDRTKLLDTVEKALKMSEQAAAHVMKICGQHIEEAVREVYELNRVDIPDLGIDPEDMVSEQASAKPKMGM
jgi:antirestriction protein ArdC